MLTFWKYFRGKKNYQKIAAFDLKLEPLMQKKVIALVFKKILSTKSAQESQLMSTALK
jgi:hypothetical protein